MTIDLDNDGMTATVNTARGIGRLAYTVRKQEGRWVVSDTVLTRGYPNGQP